MKRSIFLAALATLTSGAALAQSSVTVYGRLNVSAERQKDGDTTINALQNNASRIGFKGTEDLGGGLKASFLLEHGFNSWHSKESAEAMTKYIRNLREMTSQTFLRRSMLSLEKWNRVEKRWKHETIVSIYVIHKTFDLPALTVNIHKSLVNEHVLHYIPNLFDALPSCCFKNQVDRPTSGIIRCNNAAFDNK